MTIGAHHREKKYYLDFPRIPVMGKTHESMYQEHKGIEEKKHSAH